MSFLKSYFYFISKIMVIIQNWLAEVEKSLPRKLFQNICGSWYGGMLTVQPVRSKETFFLNHMSFIKLLLSTECQLISAHLDARNHWWRVFWHYIWTIWLKVAFNTVYIDERQLHLTSCLLLLIEEGFKSEYPWTFEVLKSNIFEAFRLWNLSFY